MLPTFNHGSVVLAERITSRLGKVGPGDVVLIRRPDDPRTVVAKRVKGVEGDVISYILDPKISDEQKTVVVIVLKLFFRLLLFGGLGFWRCFPFKQCRIDLHSIFFKHCSMPMYIDCLIFILLKINFRVLMIQYFKF